MLVTCTVNSWTLDRSDPACLQALLSTSALCHCPIYRCCCTVLSFGQTKSLGRKGTLTDPVLSHLPASLPSSVVFSSPSIQKAGEESGSLVEDGAMDLISVGHLFFYGGPEAITRTSHTHCPPAVRAGASLGAYGHHVSPVEAWVHGSGSPKWLPVPFSARELCPPSLYPGSLSFEELWPLC